MDEVSTPQEVLNHLIQCWEDHLYPSTSLRLARGRLLVIMDRSRPPRLKFMFSVSLHTSVNECQIDTVRNVMEEHGYSMIFRSASNGFFKLVRVEEWPTYLAEMNSRLSRRAVVDRLAGRLRDPTTETIRWDVAEMVEVDHSQPIPPPRPWKRT